MMGDFRQKIPNRSAYLPTTFTTADGKRTLGRFVNRRFQAVKAAKR